ncbi:Gfo/Idh/MocA family oxidoreductase [Paenibacillus humicola]|uniref:Gfo/Idh/MocA family oxidoreductase n=1 Tax=Paenibacillus humicola TaxID=3110540 RepID=UPI00237B4F85|nr:Gfo/Idh/MocA family oxidoreductase [Paenibacillus humicola]
MEQAKLRAGLIGYGYAGRTFHAPVMTAVPGIALVKVVERRTEASKERYPWVQIARDVKELYEDPLIDLVVVTTPSTDHYTFVKDALAAGKHVVVEKPFTTTSEEAGELIALAREKGLTLSVFHNRRWDGDFLTVQNVVRQGLIGDITEAELRWERYFPVTNPGRWRDNGEKGSGTLYDLGVHFIDQALTLFGMPQTVTAHVGKQREGAVSDDSFDVTLGFASGLRARLRSSMLVREPGPRYALHGTKGSFVKYGYDPQEAALRNGQTPAEPNWGVEPESEWGVLNTTLGGNLHVTGRIETIRGSYADYYRNVYDHIVNGSELAVRPEQARDAIRVIELALKSVAEGRTVETAAQN